jgi:tetratricopeptide (TPR) repeat protein
MDVGCQACHGPGQKHVEWAEKEEEGQVEEVTDYGLLVDFSNADARFEVNACAPCHSRRAPLREVWSHTGHYHDHFRLQTLSENLYFPDGQILDEVYVFGSFLQSKMYEKVVRCTHCHNPHSLKFWVSGNALCTQCHQRQAVPEFPSLAQKNYNSTEHHFHPADSEGARCVNCHMPERTYMVVDPRSDHSFRIPRPDLSAKLGTPNTCNSCHKEESFQWAADAVRGWYGDRPAAEPEAAEVFASGRRGDPASGPLLADIARNPAQPSIIRATALELLRRFGATGFDAATRVAGDAEPMVRAHAVAALEQMNASNRLRTIAPLLSDPIRRVRVEAARVLASVPLSLFSQDQRRTLTAALEEFKEAQLAMSDMPWAHLNLGVLYTDLGRPGQAEAAYRKAMHLDPTFLPAQINLANLLNQSGRNREAEKILREAVSRAADQGELHYNLGLLLAEMGKLEEAVQVLARAADLMPNRARIRYNRALALQHLGRRQEAEEAMLKAHEIEPEDPDLIYALAVFYAQDGEWEKALGFAEKLQELLPTQPGPRNLLEQIRRKLAG